MISACHSSNEIRKVDLHCQTNNAAHKTNEISTKQLIVRRGQPFLMTLEMAYAFQPSEKVQLTVETGRFASESQGTKCTFSNQAPMCVAGSKAVWSCKVDDRSNLQRGILSLLVTPPVDAPVGKYSLLAEIENRKAVKESLVVLFNPWCRDDWVHLPDEKERQEYVMNEQGLIYKGTAHQIQPMIWEFGQVSFKHEWIQLTQGFFSPTGSTMERVVYDHAIREMNLKPDSNVQQNSCKVIDSKVEMTLQEETSYITGQDIKLNLVLSNRDNRNKTMVINVNAQAMSYFGNPLKNVLHARHDKTLLPGQVVNVPILIPYSAYSAYSAILDSVKVSVLARDNNGDIYEAETDLALEDPPLSIKVLGETRVNCPLTILVEFQNPLKETLRCCSLTVVGCGLFGSQHLESNLGDVEPNSSLTVQIQTVPYKAGLKTVVADFDCSAFRDLKGSVNVYIKP
ncbi:PREDICTED: protein-glutamine gamma-glutamyltransferase 5-like [Cyprinodon variegatus]|uniref:protein-glutamine gamma-glutamyltransferase 5-like n=1 Tax=Cyprinodon variegatus TaxID=28743 RepID=UPI0007428E33|nr:PREDICTED: protein-glutamine gamma-glutamyltransferase 5-like [Cyprinodon variegatus]